MDNLIAEVGGVQSEPIKVSRPKWEDMFENYPNSNIATFSLYRSIGGQFPNCNTNQDIPNYLINSCAFRMSRGLNLSGVTLPNKTNKDQFTLIGGDKRVYWGRVKELYKIMRSKEFLGEPEIVVSLVKAKFGEKKKGLSLEAMDLFGQKQGIIMFNISGWSDATGHFTLWDGKNLLDAPGHDDPNDELYYFHLKEDRIINGKQHVVQTDEILLWELK